VAGRAWLLLLAFAVPLVAAADAQSDGVWAVQATGRVGLAPDDCADGQWMAGAFYYVRAACDGHGDATLERYLPAAGTSERLARLPAAAGLGTVHVVAPGELLVVTPGAPALLWRESCGCVAARAASPAAPPAPWGGDARPSHFATANGLTLVPAALAAPPQQYDAAADAFRPASPAPPRFLAARGLIWDGATAHVLAFLSGGGHAMLAYDGAAFEELPGTATPAWLPIDRVGGRLVQTARDEGALLAYEHWSFDRLNLLRYNATTRQYTFLPGQFDPVPALLSWDGQAFWRLRFDGIAECLAPAAGLCPSAPSPVAPLLPPHHEPVAPRLEGCVLHPEACVEAPVVPAAPSSLILPAVAKPVRDSDRDGVQDEADNCPAEPNAAQQDLDLDRQGDACDADRDGDGIAQQGVAAFPDNCPDTPNADQADLDGAGPGDACSPLPVARTATPRVAPPAAPAPPPLAGVAPPHPLLAGLGVAVFPLWALWRTVPAAAVGLFSRLGGQSVADQPTRARILAHLAAAPGIHFNELARLAGCGRGALQHHLQVLERAGLVRQRKAGRYVCVYLASAPACPTDGLLKTDLACRLEALLHQEPGITVVEAARRLETSYGATVYHLRRLSGVGLVELRGAPLAAFRVTPAP
jgi:DNA-binding MarR family transcriptional regulator